MKQIKEFKIHNKVWDSAKDKIDYYYFDKHDNLCYEQWFTSFTKPLYWGLLYLRVDIPTRIQKAYYDDEANKRI